MIMNRPITGRTVLCGMILFFSVIFAVNGTFLYFAMSTWPGLTSSKSYEDGKKYNQLLAAAERQKPLNWESRADLDRSGNFILEITNQGGQPVPGLEISAVFTRAAHANLDTRTRLTRAGRTSYITKVPAIIPGLWRIEVRGTKDGQPVYFKVHEVLVEE